MYYPDLSQYVNIKGKIEKDVWTVGWLDANHEYPKGFVSNVILRKVLALCFRPAAQTRGFHRSPFLAPSPIGYPVELDGKTMLLGSAEIRVAGQGNRMYAAPNLIFHYMKDYHYLPPSEFISSVESSG